MYIQSYENKGSVIPQKAEPCEQGFSLGFSPISGDVETLINVRIEDGTHNSKKTVIKNVKHFLSPFFYCTFA